MFGDSNGQIKLRAKQKFKFLSATDHKGWAGRSYAIQKNFFIYVSLSVEIIRVKLWLSMHLILLCCKDSGSDTRYVNIFGIYKVYTVDK